MKIIGKVAIVIGGGNGIGKECCRLLLANGAKVCIGDIQELAAQSTITSFKETFGPDSCFFVKCDVTKIDAINEAFKMTEETFGVVEIFLNTAGIIDEANWQRCFDINVGGCIRCLEVAMKHMGKNRNGREGVIVLLASISGLKPESFGPVYSASKHAVNGLARSWALPHHYELHGIRINTLCPTNVATGFLEQLDGCYFSKETKAVVQTFRDNGLQLTPEFVAGGFLKLVEDDSANGQCLRVTKAHGYDYATFQETPNQ